MYCFPQSLFHLISNLSSCHDLVLPSSEVIVPPVRLRAGVDEKYISENISTLMRLHDVDNECHGKLK